MIEQTQQNNWQSQIAQPKGLQQTTLQQTDAGWWIVCQQQKIWLLHGDIPCGTASKFALTGQQAVQIGRYQQLPVWLVLKTCSKHMVSLRQLIDNQELFQLAGRGVQLAEFYRSHQFCGACGQPMVAGNTEWVMLCSKCSQRYYPQIAPCIIVAIRQREHILLAQHTRHRNSIYTVLAGFVEVGETLEQTVAREVFEESGIQIKNLRYVTSQPWPFPHSLMAAYMAEYAAGELTLDTNELLDAGWYRYDQLPALPPAGTVARRLIEDTVALCRQQDQAV